MKAFAAVFGAMALGATMMAQQAPAPAAGAPGGQAAQGRGRGGRQNVAQGPRPMHVYIYGGMKTHAEGQHDYPQFIADWSKILQNRGAYVDAGLHFPTARELADVDVLVIYKGDAGYVSLADRATLDDYLRGGGGIVTIHDALCADDPEYFANIVGGAKKHGQVNYTLEANVPYTIKDPSHPIMQGMTDFAIKDEAFFLMTWSKDPEIHVLATAVIDKTPSAGTHAGEEVPQIWTYEKSLAPAPTGQPYRAFVWMQGHNYSNFSNPQVQGMLLRGIAWAGRQPIDALATERPAGRGGRGGTQPQPGRGAQ